VREFGRRHPRTNVGEACNAVPVEKVSVSIPLTCEERGGGSACVCRTSNNRSRCLFQPYEWCASTLQSSLCEMPAYKNFKQLVAQHRRVIRQASGYQALGSQLPPPRPPLERLLANQLARYRLAESDFFEYVQSVTGATAFVPPK
jgi:hypothetical protein